jgi:hypothetical protein
MRLPDTALDVMAAQFGVIARFQLLESMTPAAVDSSVKRGLLVPIERGVYRSSTSPDIPEQRPLAAALRARPDAKITGPFVLALHRLAGLPVTASWEILTRPGRRLRNAGFKHRIDPTPQEQSVELNGLPTVPVVTALIDTGRFIDEISERTLRLAYDNCRWNNLITVEDVVNRAQALGEKDPGARIFLEWHDRGELVPESHGERHLGRVVCRITPPPEPQVRIAGYRIDWYWPAYRFGLEYQGVTDHRSARKRHADTHRTNNLRRKGVHIHPVHSWDLKDDHRLLQDVLALLAQRAQQLGLPAPALC